jgi:hypothetical protein
MNLGWPLGRNDDGLTYRRVPRECMLDLPGLDPKAADLDLSINPAEVFEIAVGSPSGEVSGAIEASTRPLAEWVGDESFRGQAGPVEISPRYPGAAYV